MPELLQEVVLNIFEDINKEVRDSPSRYPELKERQSQPANLLRRFILNHHGATGFYRTINLMTLGFCSPDIFKESLFTEVYKLRREHSAQ